MTQPHTTPPRLLRMPSVQDRVGLCKASIYNRIKDGTFPKPVSLGGKSVAWLESDINQWIAERCQAANQDAA
ncbi:AlpA family transcriptional regulator [Alkalimonas sp. MEB108]|uniref:AlpA family transcriptional regulator n=1 Tax=Alkalimonas cellulosilytica TaxID=3058395 RepID=A0ABU7J1X4_9GAMM|nr:AlpA family transcriptional regulator [Alkalimonas sp. MEB108]MEE2000022.1 AlpA family transcriptional regulator [Alkalimonas sp. MEB108]